MDVIKETKFITKYTPLSQTVKENRHSYQNSIHLQRKESFIILLRLQWQKVHFEHILLTFLNF